MQHRENEYWNDYEDSAEARKELDEAFYDDAGYPEVKESDTEGPTHTPYDFTVVLPGRMFRIAQDDPLSWLTLFYALP